MYEECIKKFLSNNNDKIEFIRLPKYSPIWKNVKQGFMHNKFFENKEAFVNQLKKTLKHFENNSLEVTSLMKKLSNIYANI